MVGIEPNIRYFKPRGIPMADLEDVLLTIDEMEAVRLADLEGLYQEEAAQRMNVSRQTFGRIVSSARRKIADALINAKALRVDGGDYMMVERLFRCTDCNHTWPVAKRMRQPRTCPNCAGVSIYREQ
jgi:predicted DNA-binding protein (UPF0251 family)